MTDSGYSPLVIEHFHAPRNAGVLPPGPDVIVGTAGTAEQGAMFTLSAQIVGERLGAVRFAAYGCPHCLAAGSWLSERFSGVSRADLEDWRWQEAAAALDVPAEKRGRLLVLEDAVRALAGAWRARG